MAQPANGSTSKSSHGPGDPDTEPPPSYHAELPSRGRAPAPPSYRPPLPPRSPKHLSPSPSPGPPARTWSTRDPRSHSTDSLTPRSPAASRRTLLLIYIHGFHGNETSFQAFPAHVHNLATGLLARSHVVHTKIYPRYQSRKAISFARDNFSNW